MHLVLLIVSLSSLFFSFSFSFLFIFVTVIHSLFLHYGTSGAVHLRRGFSGSVLFDGEWVRWRRAQVRFKAKPIHLLPYYFPGQRT